MITFEQVLVFHKIVQCGSFKAAAAELHKTQPAISFTIKNLEAELAVQLFDRSDYRPSLTKYGKAFYERSQRILNGMMELNELGESFRNQEEPEIGFTLDSVSLNPNLLKFFKVFIDKHPYTKLNLNFDILSEVERKILNRETEIGLTHFISDQQSLEIVPVTKVRMVPVMNTELFKQRKIKSEADLMEIDQIVVSDKNGSKGASFGLLEGGKKWRLMDSNFKREIILAGLGWGHLPEISIERELREKRLTTLNFDNVHPKVLEGYLIRLKKRPLGPVAKKLWEELISFHL